MLSQTLPAPATQLFRYLFEQASLGIAVEDLDGRILLANPVLCSMLGYEEHELCAMSCSQFARPEDSEDDWAHFQKLRAGLIDHYSLEKRYVRKDGAMIWGRLNVSLYKADGGATPLVFAFVEEITQRRRTEDALRESEQRFRLAAQAGKMYAYEWDAVTDMVIRSDDHVSVLGYKEQVERLTRQQITERVHPDDRMAFLNNLDQISPTNPRSQISYRVLRPDGSSVWVEKSQRGFFDEQGKLLRVIGIVADITERRRGEEALQCSEANYRLFVSQSSEGIFCQELDRPIPVDLPEDEQVQRILRESYMAECNEAMARMYGFSAAAFVGMRLTDTLDAENPANIELTRDYIRSGYRVVDRESHEVDAQGNPKVFLNSMIGIVENGVLLRTWGIQRDVTARWQAEKARTLVEQALRESEQRFRLAAQAGKMFAYDWDAATDVIMRSPEAAQILGIDEAANLTGAEILTKVHPDDREMLSAAMAALSPEKPNLQISYRMLRPDGTLIWVERNSRAHFSEHGTLLRIVGMVVDITDRKQAEEALRQKDEALMEAQRLAGVGSWQWDSRSDSVIWSSELFRLMGLDPQLPAPSYKEHERLFTAESWERLRRAVEAGLQNGTPYELELEVVSPKSKVKWETARGEPLRDGRGQIIGLRGTVQDITERRRAEEAIRESEQRFRLVANKAPVMIWMSGTDKLCTYFNEPWLEFTGRLLAAELGNGWAEGVHPDDLTKCLDTYVQAFDRRESFDMEYRLRRNDGEYRWISDTGVPRLDSDRNFAGYIGSCVDVTDRKLAEEALKKSEEKFSKAFRDSPLALTVTSALDHRYIDVNETFERITGWRRDEIIGRTPFDIELWVDASERVQIVNRLMAERSLRNLELRFRMRDGSVRIGLSSAELIELEGEPCILGVTADITDYKRSQEALRESEDKLRLLLDSTAEAIYGIDLEHRCTFCNPACLRTLGYERVDQVLGKNMHDLMHHSRVDGTMFPIEECRVHRVTTTGEGVHAEDEVFWRANATSFPAEYWSYPQRKGQQLVGAVVAFIDITQRKSAEVALAGVSRRLIEAQEQERARIARELHDDIGQRISMLAIEIEELQNNSSDLPTPVHNRVRELWQQTCDIATDVQSLSHELHSAKLEYLGIVAAMRGFCNDFGRQQSLEIEFEANDMIGSPPPDVSLCLLRVLQEALHNSAKHSGVRRHSVRLWGNEKEVHLTVSDSGLGFNREEARQNPGLGLVSMEERLKLVNGTLTIESYPKSGTTIHATVPLRPSATLLRATG
jgi:PAS domain S-box-containing protein